MLIRGRVAGAACLIAALTLIGCNSENPNNPAKVSGRVNYNGSPVGGGSITFHTADGTPVQGAIDHDGSYAFDGLPEGTMTVTIETESINPGRKKTEYGNAGGGAAAKYGKGGGGGSAPKGKGAEKSPAPEGTQTVAQTYVKIPAKYTDKSTSGLTVTLKKGKQTQNFDLTD